MNGVEEQLEDKCESNADCMLFENRAKSGKNGRLVEYANLHTEEQRHCKKSNDRTLDAR